MYKTVLSVVLLFLLLPHDRAWGAVPEGIGPEVGKIAPSFELKDISGNKISLPQTRGKVVLLNFWATTCGPCREEMPSMNRLYSELKDRGFVVLAVSIDRSEKAVRSFASEQGLSFPVLMDVEREVFFDHYAVTGLPTTFLIDRSGVIAERVIGQAEWDSPELRQRVLRLINRKEGAR